LPTVVLLVLFTLMTGCTADEDHQKEIRDKVRRGEHEEAVNLAHKYFADDKRVLLVTLEYIADQKHKALKKAYIKNVTIEDVDLRTEASGGKKVIGRLVNKGNKTITGFGIKAGCERNGRIVHEVRTRYLADIGPGMSSAFQCEARDLANCDTISVEIIDLGLR